MEIVASPARKPMSLRFWYGDSIPKFVGAPPSNILGEIASNSGFAILPTQRSAWLKQIDLLHSQLQGLAGSIFFEFNIPRMGRRIDVVLVIDALIFAIEFKVGERVFDQAAVEQVWDYGLDLKNFHEASHDASIVPILIATEASGCGPIQLFADPDKVYRPIVVDANSLRTAIVLALGNVSAAPVNADEWARASYHPTPTIVEAARALYAQHSVEAIARFDAGAQNLHVTSQRIEELVDEARANGRKRICLVTGVPGAGKTLVGLNLATRQEENEPTHAVFLSGNAPLVAGTTRSSDARRVRTSQKTRAKDAQRKSWRKRQSVHPEHPPFPRCRVIGSRR